MNDLSEAQNKLYSVSTKMMMLEQDDHADEEISLGDINLRGIVMFTDDLLVCLFIQTPSSYITIHKKMIGRDVVVKKSG